MTDGRLTQEPTPALSVIIVTWNAEAVIDTCLDALAASVIPGPVEVIVVDNASSDGTAEAVARRGPGVHLLRSAANLGFAAANNRAIAVARADTLLLLNPDAILADPTAVARMMWAIADRPEAGMVGPRLVFPDGRHQVGDAGFRPGARGLIVHALGLAHLDPALPALFRVRPDAIVGAALPVDWVCGACLLVRRSLVEAIGGLDERMFLYAEDVEWGCRARAAGFSVLYLPHIRVVHLQGTGESQAAGDRVSTRWLSALLALHARLDGERHLPLVRAAFVVGFGLRAAIFHAASLPPWPGRLRFRARAHAMRAYARAAWRG